MALTENPKLAMIPSGYGDYKVYSVLPSDGTGDFDFVRSTSATRVNKSGLIETVGFDVPRLNYPLIDGEVSGCPSLLLEPQSKNLVTYSNDFTNVIWTKTFSTITDNAIISPDGTLNADKLVEDSSNNQHRIDFVSTSGINTNTFSLFAKKAERNVVWLRIGTDGAYFNLDDGSVEGFSGGITTKSLDYGNGWWRLSITKTSIAANEVCRINLVESGFNNTYLGDGTSGIYIYGAQLEEQSYATSYIPTNGSTVTRNAETASKSGLSSYINSQEGVLYAEISALANDGTNRFLSINDGSNDNEVRFYFESTSNTIGFNVRANSSDILTSTNYVVSNAEDFAKMAIVYKSGRNEFYVNGLKVYDSSDTFTFSSDLTDIKFSRGSGGSPFYGKTKQIQYFDTALNDTDLETLTSWTSFSEMARDLLYTIQ